MSARFTPARLRFNQRHYLLHKISRSDINNDVIRVAKLSGYIEGVGQWHEDSFALIGVRD